jgi:hypothetical protein
VWKGERGHVKQSDACPKKSTTPYICTSTTSKRQTDRYYNSTIPALSLTFIQTPAPPPPNSTRKLPEYVYIHLLLLRLKEHGTDVLVNVNIPHYSDEYEKADKEGEETRLMRDSKVVRERVLETFKVVEWGLFDG